MPKKEDTDRSLIVTGSSAGGIDALSTFVSGLPPNLPAAVIIAQHLDPSQESHLGAILEKRSALPVKQVREHEMLEMGTLYVVAPNCDVEVEDSEAASKVQARKGPKPSVDRLFSSAAEAYGERLIAIVLSGMGSDGLAGARIVKEHGGTVIIQDPASASYPAMPLAIPPTLVDVVARPEEMGKIVYELLAGSNPPQAAADQNLLRTLLSQVRDRTGIDFLQYKTPTIMRRLARLMVTAGAGSLAEYMRYLQLHPEGYQKLAGTFLIKVTEFFRDSQLFEELQKTILPKLMNEAEERGELRIWSAGASTGEEAYSLAILCAELLREDYDRMNVRIFATDLDEDAVNFARRGVYSAEALRRVPARWLERYFIPIGDSYEVSKVVRNMTVFGQHDLAQRAPFPRTDLCMCRNVLIYFTKELQGRALQLFAFSLREGGYLILGKSESTTPLKDSFKAVDSSLKIYQRQGGRVLIPTRLMEPIGGEERASASRLFPPRIQPSVEVDAMRQSIGTAITSSSIGVVVVDRTYDIVEINAAARSLLEIHGVAVGQDLIHLATLIRDGELRALVDAAFRREPVVAREFHLEDRASGIERWLRISAHAVSAKPPTQAAKGSPQVGSVTLLILDVTEEIRLRREFEKRATDQAAALEELSKRIDELSQRQKSLLEANNELNNVNSELRDLNHELTVSAEEAASANEEVETLNEEMQATNEELETLNEELQAAIEELNTTKDELEARTAELEKNADVREERIAQLEQERVALSAALKERNEPIAVVNEKGVLLFASDVIVGHQALAQLDGDWWQRPSTVKLDGVTYSTKPRRSAGGGCIVVRFEPGT